MENIKSALKFLQDNIDESNIPKEHYEYEIAELMEMYADYYHKEQLKILNISDVIKWVRFDFNKIETRPSKYGKYLITRKDGKIHWETWNGSGWAYNHNEICFWAEIKLPCLSDL